MSCSFRNVNRSTPTSCLSCLALSEVSPDLHPPFINSNLHHWWTTWTMQIVFEQHSCRPKHAICSSFRLLNFLCHQRVVYFEVAGYHCLSVLVLEKWCGKTGQTVIKLKWLIYELNISSNSVFCIPVWNIYCTMWFRGWSLKVISESIVLVNTFINLFKSYNNYGVSFNILCEYINIDLFRFFFH